MILLLSFISWRFVSSQAGKSTDRRSSRQNLTTAAAKVARHDEERELERKEGSSTFIPAFSLPCKPFAEPTKPDVNERLCCTTKTSSSNKTKAPDCNPLAASAYRQLTNPLLQAPPSLPSICADRKRILNGRRFPAPKGTIILLQDFQVCVQCGNVRR